MELMGWTGDFKEITGELQIRNVGIFRGFN
jgi:hypothetical protein